MSLYNYYVPIQIWKTKESYNNLGYLFRFYPISNENNFDIPTNLETYYPEEWKNINNWRDFWELETIVYGFSPMYRGTLNRGYVMLNIYDNIVFPYNSINVTVNNLDTFFDIKKCFITMLYPFFPLDNIFSILYISLKSNTVQDIVVYNEDYENKEYNFLSGTTKTWSNNYYPYNNNLLLYIFTKIPNFTNWKINSETICIPSTNKNDFPSLLDCNLNNHKLKNKLTFVQNNSNPIVEIFSNSSYNIAFTITVIFFFILIVVIFFFHKKFST
jgi:hypothetical protein